MDQTVIAEAEAIARAKLDADLRIALAGLGQAFTEAQTALRQYQAMADGPTRALAHALWLYTTHRVEDATAEVLAGLRLLRELERQ